MASTATPPSLEILNKLQLFRTTLVTFLEWKNFSDVITGCYVRVLLEMRNEDARRESGDRYYITCVKGAQKGPVYSGFSTDGATTEWHVLVELPPCFKSTHNGNVVQLTSISNSPFRPSEYQSWVENVQASRQHFPSLPQLQFRLGMLEEQKQQALTLEPRKRRNDEDPEMAQLRERKVAEMRARIEKDIADTHVKMPLIDNLKTHSLEALQEMEREILDLITNARMAINERSKCMMCHNRLCTEICYPCKHQVLCKDCASHIKGRCPVPGCRIPVTMTFEAYTS